MVENCKHYCHQFKLTATGKLTAYCLVQTPKLGVSICLLLLFLWPMALAAQDGVTVSNLAVGTGMVTFDVSWKNAAMPSPVWSDTVWVFVDYNDVGTMKRLRLLAGLTTRMAALWRVHFSDKGPSGILAVGFSDISYYFYTKIGNRLQK